MNQEINKGTRVQEPHGHKYGNRKGISSLGAVGPPKVNLTPVLPVFSPQQTNKQTNKPYVFLNVKQLYCSSFIRHFLKFLLFTFYITSTYI